MSPVLPEASWLVDCQRWSDWNNIMSVMRKGIFDQYAMKPKNRKAQMLRGGCHLLNSEVI
jgi:hypothetical protein